MTEFRLGHAITMGHQFPRGIWGCLRRDWLPVKAVLPRSARDGSFGHDPTELIRQSSCCFHDISQKEMLSLGQKWKGRMGKEELDFVEGWVLPLREGEG